VYPFVLFLHGVLRWVVVGTAVWAIARPAEKRPGALFVASLDTQVLLGLLLYFALSPITRAALASIGTAMHVHELRFWAIEHPSSMLLALVLAHVGRVRARRAPSAEIAAKRWRLFAALALVAVLAGTPWPGLPYGRGLLPHL
jgi:hypothetical protein